MSPVIDPTAAGSTSRTVHRTRLITILSAAGSKKADDLVGSGAIPYDWQLWHYRYIEDLGKDITFEFVDTCGCGRYEMPVEKDELNKYKS